jgi:hypothetical protein
VRGEGQKREKRNEKREAETEPPTHPSRKLEKQTGIA